MKYVYTVTESIHYEDTKIVDIYGDPDSAITRAREEAGWLGGEHERTGDTFMLAIDYGDRTWLVKKHEVK